MITPEIQALMLAQPLLVEHRDELIRSFSSLSAEPSNCRETLDPEIVPLVEEYDRAIEAVESVIRLRTDQSTILIDAKQFHQKLRDAVRLAGTQRKFCCPHGILPNHLSMVMNGRRSITKRIAASIGFVPETGYRNVLNDTYLREEEFRLLLKFAVKDAGGKMEFSQQHKLDEKSLFLTLKGRRLPTEEMANAIGFTRCNIFSAIGYSNAS